MSKRDAYFRFSMLNSREATGQLQLCLQIQLYYFSLSFRPQFGRPFSVKCLG